MKTKNLILTAAIIFAGMTSAMAQEINWGVKAGANYSNLDAEMDTDHIFGVHAGLVAEFKLAPTFSLQPELLYSMEGAQSEFSFQEEEFTFSSDQKIKLGYLNIPVMAKYYAAPGFSIEAGPQVGYLLNAENEYEISSNFPDDITESGTEDIKDEMKKISFGLNFGLGYELPNNIFFQARYHLGLSDIADYTEDPEFEVDFEEIRNQSFQFSVGYKF